MDFSVLTTPHFFLAGAHLDAQVERRADLSRVILQRVCASWAEVVDGLPLAPAGLQI